MWRGKAKGVCWCCRALGCLRGGALKGAGVRKLCGALPGTAWSLTNAEETGSTWLLEALLGMSAQEAFVRPGFMYGGPGAQGQPRLVALAKGRTLAVSHALTD